MLGLPFLIEAAAFTSDPVRSLNDIVTKATQPCRKDAKTIVVCGNRSGESPYRLPPEARDPGFRVDGGVDSVSRERHALMDGGSLPTEGCGSAACMTRRWRANGQQAGFPSGIRIGPQ